LKKSSYSVSLIVEKLQHAFGVGPEPDGELLRLPTLLEKLAVQIVERQMETVAIVLLESIKPLNFLAGQTLHGVMPLIKMVGGTKNYREVANALEDRRTLGLLIRRIETLALEKTGGTK
jgi:hypothetical protein